MNEEAPRASQFASPAKLTGDPLAWNVKGVNGDKAEAQEKQRQMNENDMDCICQIQMYTTCGTQCVKQRHNESYLVDQKVFQKPVENHVLR